jgi:hypothetical protein
MNLHYGRKSVGQILDLNFIRPPPYKKYINSTVSYVGST